MSITGFVFATIIIVTDILLIGAYIVCVFLKKIYLANAIIHYMLLHLLVSVALISWSLILINNGFDMIWINVSFEAVVIILIIFIIGFSLLDTYLRKKLIYPNKGIALFGRVALPGIVLICFSACLIIYTYAATYFNFIKTIIG